MLHPIFIVWNLIDSSYEPISAREFCQLLENCFVFVCFSVQVPFLFVDVQDAILTASPGQSVTLKCVAKFNQQRPPASYKWSKDGRVLPESNSSLAISYVNAADIHKNYRCSRKSASSRDVQCKGDYQCSVSLLGLPEIRDDANANVGVILSM